MVIFFHPNRSIYFAVIKCDPPLQIKDGTFDPVKEEYDYRDSVRYTCQKDLTLNGSRLITCSDDGLFEPSAPTCISKSFFFSFNITD